MQTTNDLNDLLFVTAVAQTGSLAGAARKLGVNHATAFRRITATEARLGVRLFERKAGRYAATPAGEELARAGAVIANEAVASLRKVAGHDLRPSGVVRLTSTDSIAAAYITTMAQTCRALHPDITLHVTMSNEIHNLSRRDADIAIRPTDKPQDHLIGKRIGPLAMAAYGAKSYLRSTRRIAALGEHAWIGLDDSLSYHRTLKWLAKIKPLETLAYRTNSVTGLHRACVSGPGLALLPCFVGDGDMKLRRVTPPIRELQTELWLLMHPDLRSSARVAVVFELLLRQFRQVAPRIAGGVGSNRTRASRAKSL